MCNIVLERKSFTEKETRGIIKIGESYLGYTLEPPVLDYAGENALTALPCGEYMIVLRNNPVAGSPCIKLIGITHSCTSTIRCCKPLGKNNASIVLLSDPEGKGAPTENNTEPWMELLINVFDYPQTTLIIK